MIGGRGNIVQADQDINPNHLDLDSDNDGITDVVENSSGDINADNGSGGNLTGTVDSYSDVTDNNGWNDSSTSAQTDSDGDGVPDYLDIDADNDGIPDYMEGVCSTCPTFLRPIGGDTDGDGVLDIYATMSADNTNNTTGPNNGSTPNIDNDAINLVPDYLDTDTDSDTMNDWSEGYDLNNNGMAYDDIISMAATYEAATSNGYYGTTDTDGDGIPDWLDNMPLISGYNEMTRPPFLDHASADFHDDNGNGLVDIFDYLMNGTDAPTPDNNGILDRDWRDMSTLVALPVELRQFTASKNGCFSLLNWTSGSEVNFSRYELEWSPTGITYRSIITVEGKGENNSHDYFFQHKNTAYHNYYRLKMIDRDGTFEYSETLELIHDCNDPNGVTVYPNPVSKGNSVIQVKFFGTIETEFVELYDLMGRSISRIDIQGSEGWNTMDIQVSSFPPGSYYLKVNDHRIGKKFIITD
ncbi:MAG: T9SS type A sorting domain-containing protein [Saprospiraceae bacterium]|nr:T9SS type A sorting domain-containing protein [Saprospiraceae bacterium]